MVERFINKIKHYRRLATRYEKTVLSFGVYAGGYHDITPVNVHRTWNHISSLALTLLVVVFYQQSRGGFTWESGDQRTFR